MHLLSLAGSALVSAGAVARSKGLKLRATALIAAVVIAVGCDQPGTFVGVPDDHPAVLLASRTTGTNEFAVEAEAADLPFVCGAGGDGDQPWQLCLAHADGITALLTWGDAEGITALVTYDGLNGGVAIPLDPDRILGVRREGGAISVSLASGGRTIGSLTSAALP